MKLILALDFGGTKLAAGLTSDTSKEWLTYKRQLSPINADANTDLTIMYELIDSVLQYRKPDIIGVSFGGPVDATTGTVRLSHHVKGWENIPLQKFLEDRFGVPASVDNDANVAALGEYRFGAGQGYTSLFYITISTGVGGGWILNNQPWRGFEGMAGEIGHMVVDPAGPLCLCGKRGCVERFASGPYMAQDVREILRKGIFDTEKEINTEQGINREQGIKVKGKILRDLVGNNLELITGKTVSEAAIAGDDLAREFLFRSAWSLGVAIGNVANLINPQLFVLGGGVTKAGESFWEVLRKTARETALPEVNFEVVPANLGDDAPLWGAVALALYGD